VFPGVQQGLSVGVRQGPGGGPFAGRPVDGVTVIDWALVGVLVDRSSVVRQAAIPRPRTASAAAAPSTPAIRRLGSGTGRAAWAAPRNLGGPVTLWAGGR
jgi:hypothetical protein